MSDSRNLRRCLGKFATGVTVVSCRDADGLACGITANSFSSVSLDPPLILWNIAKVSRSLNAYLQAEYFAINILRTDQKELSARFARSEDDLFHGVAHTDSIDGVPVIDGTLAHFLCRTSEIHECGDHHIIVGEVTDYLAHDGDPLLYFNGTYANVR